MFIYIIVDQSTEKYTILFSFLLHSFPLVVYLPLYPHYLLFRNKSNLDQITAMLLKKFFVGGETGGDGVSEEVELFSVDRYF